MKVTCGAYARSTGQPCQAPRVSGKRRCKLHGGFSTGPRTAEGKRRISEAQKRRWQKSSYSPPHPRD
jgi:hypothetical protein